MSEYDQRQYKMMLERINAFANGQIDLHKLTDDLDGLLNVLEKVNADWRQNFLHYWGKLEDARAVALERTNVVVDNDAVNRVSLAISQLRQLVLQVII